MVLSALKTVNSLMCQGMPLSAAVARKVTGGFAEQMTFRQRLDLCRTPLSRT